MSTTLTSAVKVRRARRGDLSALVALERSLPGERMSRADLARLLGQESVEVWVAETDGVVVGDAVVLFRRGFDSGLLYSMAVDPNYRGRGIAKMLLASAEEGARERGVLVMRLEVHEENAPALELYRQSGYRVRGKTSDYYQDQSGALRLVKRFVNGGAKVRAVPYHPQTFSFTSGPAALMMGMRFFGYPVPFDRWLELTLWREATTTFLPEHAGGLSAHGVAVSALRRGFQTRVVTPAAGLIAPPSTEREGEAEEVARLSHEGFERELRSLGGRLEVRDFDHADAALAVKRGAVPLVLLAGVDAQLGEAVDEARWVVITGFDDHHLFLHDPYLAKGVGRADNVHLVMKREAFNEASHHESVGQPAMVLLMRWGSVNRRRE